MAQLRFKHWWNWHIKLLYILMHQPTIFSTWWGFFDTTIFGNLLKQTISSSFSCIVYQIFSLCVCPKAIWFLSISSNSNTSKAKWREIKLETNTKMIHFLIHYLIFYQLYSYSRRIYPYKVNNIDTLFRLVNTSLNN